MKNDELEDLISKFQSVRPSAFQMARWKRSTVDRGWIKFAAGLAAGIILGLVLAKSLSAKQPEATESYASNVNYFYQNP